MSLVSSGHLPSPSSLALIILTPGSGQGPSIRCASSSFSSSRLAQRVFGRPVRPVRPRLLTSENTSLKPRWSTTLNDKQPTRPIKIQAEITACSVRQSIKVKPRFGNDSAGVPKAAKPHSSSHAQTLSKGFHLRRRCITTVLHSGRVGVCPALRGMRLKDEKPGSELDAVTVWS